jgi:hypothetical protein
VEAPDGSGRFRMKAVAGTLQQEQLQLQRERDLGPEMEL